MNKFLKISVLIAQILLGVTFLFSGFVKAIDPVGSTIKVGDYLLAFGLTIPHSLIGLLAMSQAMVEFLLGAWTLLGIWKKTTGWLIFLFMLVMTLFTLYLAIYHPVSDCGCFGEAIKLTNWQTFSKNVVLLVLAFFYLRYSSYVTIFYGRHTSRWATCWCLLFLAMLMYHCERHLPLIDFMPFKTGNDIYALTHVPPAAARDSFTYQFVYEKDGKQAVFTEDSLPVSGSGWNYVDRRQRLVREGVKPVIQPFSIQHPMLGDITERVLKDTSYVFLFVSQNLETSDSEHTDRTVNAYTYARSHHYRFYGLTSSDTTAIEEWLYENDTDIGFCSADDKLLTTMIRSNPGLVLLKHGVVYRKWAQKDIPDFTVVKKPLNELNIGRKRNVNPFRIAGLTILCFALPLLLLYQLRTSRLARKRQLLFKKSDTKQV